MTALDPLIAALRDRRVAAGLSMTALAAAIGCTPGFVSELESGRRPNPTLATLRKIGQALGVQPGWLPLAYEPGSITGAVVEHLRANLPGVEVYVGSIPETAPAAHLRAAGNGAAEGGPESPSVAPASDPVPVVFGDRADVAHVAAEDPTGCALWCSCGSWSMLYRNSMGLHAATEHANHAAKARTLDVAERTVEKARPH